MTTEGKLTVKFLHPRNSTHFTAELGPATTGEKALDGLVKAKFIEPASGTRAYALHPDKPGAKTIPLSAALATAGVEDGDTVAVTETTSGAGA